MKRILLTKLVIVLALLLCLANTQENEEIQENQEFLESQEFQEDQEFLEFQENQEVQETQESSLIITIITGPVIGKVTTSTARILFEFNTAATITVILTDPAGNQKNTTRDVTGSVPFIFTFDGLQQETKYTVSLSLDGSVSNMIESYFTTLGPPTGNLKFATISCFDRFFQAQKTPEADLWANLLARVRNNEIQYLIHSGDQVYMDDKLGSPSPEKPYYAIQTILTSTPREEWGNRRAEMIEILRSEYRFDWSIPNVRETLAKVPSLMIFDDHEIRDDWGYLPQDYDPNSLDYYYGGMARQVYYEYQRQLREDVDFGNFSNMTAEYFYEVLNGVAFYFIDYRGIRTWNRDYSQMNDMQLGVTQWAYLDQLLEPNVGTLAEARSFVLVSPLAVVYLVEALVEIGYFSINDAQESWTYAYVDEQARLLDILKNWKEGRDGREVLIVDGDVHMGGWTKIKYRIDTVFIQYTSSSMASSAPSDAVFFGFDVVKELQNLKNPWTYEHHDWTNDYNYGIVIARVDGDESEVNAYMVKASFDTSPELIGSDGKEIDDSDWADILSGND